MKTLVDQRILEWSYGIDRGRNKNTDDTTFDLRMSLRSKIYEMLSLKLRYATGTSPLVRIVPLNAHYVLCCPSCVIDKNGVLGATATSRRSGGSQ